MAKKQFKAESKRLLDLMINSIYTHKEIFLRELISNASDAIDKLYFRSLTDSSVGLAKEDFKIELAIDKDARTLTISDNGCGMTKDELIENLGTIAKSGSLSFKKENETGEDINIIGQFGVGFYSAFMVSSDIKVISKAFGEEQGYIWESKGDDGYTVTECPKLNAGTDIILTLKEDTEEEDYSKYLERYTISSLVKKYSDYIRYPIHMDMEKSRKKENSDEYETYMEDTVLNSMIPIWHKNKSDITEEDYNGFYKSRFFDFTDPVATIHTKVEGRVFFNALMYIPENQPMNYFAKDYKPGLALYSNSVMIMENCEDLLPDYFGFVKGLVDSPDFSLNISREILQHDAQLKFIAENLKKKIKAELEKLLKNDREKYEKFFKSFGLSLKYGMYENYGANKDFLKDLILFYSVKQGKQITLKEYVEAMPEGQKDIYYACGESNEKIARLPQTELVYDKGYDILCFTEDIDEFAIKVLYEYEGKQFKSVADKDLDLSTEEEKKENEKKAQESKSTLEKVKTALGDKVKDVRLSFRLKSSAVCLTADGPLSIEMEKVLNNIPNQEGVKADRVLEINPDHPVFKALENADEEKIGVYAKLLYDQALLIEGLPIDDPVEFSNNICSLMS